MSRPARPWFRFYTEAFNDRKMLRLTPVQRWIWVAILGAARESPEAGSLHIAEGVAMTYSELARFADVSEREVRRAVPIMASLGMIVAQDDVITVVNWGHRQFESDNVTARTQAHRERSEEQAKEQDGNVPKNVQGNTPETETETETDKKPPSADADAMFAEFWKVYPRREDRGHAIKAFRSATKKVSAEELIAAASSFAQRVKAHRTEKKFIALASTWLNGERWLDDQSADEPGDWDLASNWMNS